ncbi:cytochrome c-type biogenesis protein CcmH [Ponticoccus sp. SC2-23]|uniref:cytochrome c-type biogenesis protein n=1 Tax=Alexandriicola marinus TaxID=2081710 RepID=UPI000FDA729D|nr:cytochrome c-type biogenesis protein [Alexandriicola marinus]MBM1219248.1 cytochrome c-type biogenesis protein CcmH [Ponticoccus sp. SC6-9]MBM1223680.1 cytochrome c-type biogenesis protein CcmH [Ponticoccus sp. SC6-15]MBM1229061.1 cytochrome c-type biogenesis protein CcmH [Ponticoccus sp. SC6-38]MBM1232646.1 cytochrome c-type biogenesis protein CcmH [Ponticoccus sp. SC6-45]MBM1237404.1 cytochrome c-type biogenesis protein CcmH [Ponticoccus sp. SC6-49]MBM1241657.1 cytochrome c-type biogenes
MKKLLLLLLLLAAPAFAVQPDEVLDDPVLEERARDISAGLRCPVCRNESIDDSNAPISRELRLMVRERLVEGDTDQEVVDFVVARYGEYVLLRPDTRGWNMLLWLSAPILLILGLAIALVTVRRRNAARPAEMLSAEEQARLDELLKE